MDATANRPQTEPLSELTISDYLSQAIRGVEQIVCKQCRDLGFYYLPAFDRQAKGGYRLCECQRGFCREDCRPPYEFYDRRERAMRSCDCRRARLELERLLQLAARAHIPFKYEGCFLDSIEISGHPDLGVAVSLAEEIITTFQQRGRSSPGLYIYGATGCGKTLLGCAILNEIMRFFLVPVYYAKISRDILGRLRASFNPNSQFYGTGQKIEEQLATVDALVIDDFGIHRDTEWVQSVLYDLIDARYENNRLTIITSNDPMDYWKEITAGRIYSRLREMCREVHIDAPDYRLRMAHYDH